MSPLLPGILLLWSEDAPDITASIYGLYSQVYPILIATAASIGKDKRELRLSLFEAHFALAVTASPMSFYLSCIALYNALCGCYELLRITSTNTAQVCHQWLALLLPFLWLAISVVTSFSTKAFKNSHLCYDVDVGKWFEFIIRTNFFGFVDVMGLRDLWTDLTQRNGLGTISVILLWIWGVYFVRHIRCIRARFSDDRAEYRNLFFLSRWPRYVVLFLRITWYVHSRVHIGQGFCL